jgi:hypothetical protein
MGRQSKYAAARASSFYLVLKMVMTFCVLIPPASCAISFNYQSTTDININGADGVAYENFQDPGGAITTSNSDTVLVVTVAVYIQTGSQNKFKIESIKWGSTNMILAKSYDSIWDEADSFARLSVWYLAGSELVGGKSETLSFNIQPTEPLKRVGSFLVTKLSVSGAAGVVPVSLNAGSPSSTITVEVMDQVGSVNPRLLDVLLIKNPTTSGRSISAIGSGQSEITGARSTAYGFGMSYGTPVSGSFSFQWSNDMDKSWAHIALSFMENSPCQTILEYACDTQYGHCVNPYLAECSCKDGYSGSRCTIPPGRLLVHPRSAGYYEPCAGCETKKNIVWEHNVPPSAAPCTFQKNTELLGANMLGGYNHILNNTGECCQLCKSTAGCKGWKFDKSSDTKTRGECWLQSTVGIERASSQYDSGIVFGSELGYSFVEEYNGYCNWTWANTGTKSGGSAQYIKSLSAEALKSCYDMCAGYGMEHIYLYTGSGKCYCSSASSISCLAGDEPSVAKTYTYRETPERLTKAIYLATCTNTDVANGKQAKVTGVTAYSPNGRSNGIAMTEVKNLLVSDSSLTYSITKQVSINVPTPSSTEVNTPTPSSTTINTPTPSSRLENGTVEYYQTSVTSVDTYQISSTSVDNYQIGVATPSPSTTEYTYTTTSRRLQVFKLIGGITEGTHKLNITLEAPESGASVGDLAIAVLSAENVKGSHDVFGSLPSTSETTEGNASKSTLNATTSAGGAFVDFSCFNSIRQSDGFVYAEPQQQYRVTKYDTKSNGFIDGGLSSSVHFGANDGQAVGFYWDRGTSQTGYFKHTMVGLIDQSVPLLGAATLSLNSNVANAESNKATVVLGISNVPSAPSNPIVGAADDTSLSIQYVTPFNFGGGVGPTNKLLAYRLQYKMDGLEEYHLYEEKSLVTGTDSNGVAVYGSPSSNWTVNNLVAGTTYKFRLALKSSQGYGEWSSELSVTTAAVTAVESISALSSARQSSTECKLTWTVPSSSLGYRHYSFAMTALSAGGSDAGVSVETLNITDVFTAPASKVFGGLSAQYTYRFKVIYVNDGGEGPPSSATCSPLEVYAMPISSMEDYATLSFFVPYINSGSSVGSYTLETRVLKPVVYSVSMALEKAPLPGAVGGQFRLVVDQQYSNCISWDDPAETIEKAIEAIPNVQKVKVSINTTSGDTSSRIWQVSFLDFRNSIDSRKLTVDTTYQPSVMSTHTVPVAGINRTYYFWKLSNFSQAAPLLIYFHKAGSDGQECKNDGWVAKGGEKQAHVLCMETNKESSAHYFSWLSFNVEYKAAQNSSWQIPHVFSGITGLPSGLAGNYMSQSKCDMAYNNDLSYLNATFYDVLDRAQIDASSVYLLGKEEGADMALYAGQCMPNFFKSVGQLMSGITSVKLYGNRWKISPFNHKITSIPNIHFEYSFEETHSGYCSDGWFYPDTNSQTPGQAVQLASLAESELKKCYDKCITNGKDHILMHTGNFKCYCALAKSCQSPTEAGVHTNFKLRFGGGQSDNTGEQQNGYQGCYADNVPGDLDLRVSTISDATMTIAECRSRCAGKGVYFGVKNGTMCFCDESYGSHGRADEYKCDKRCAGDTYRSTVCGGDGYLSVYKIEASTLSDTLLQEAFYPYSITKNSAQGHCLFHSIGDPDFKSPFKNTELQFQLSKTAEQKLVWYSMDKCVGFDYDRAYNSEVWACLTGGIIVDVQKTKSTGIADDGGDSSSEEGSGAVGYVGADSGLSSGEKPACAAGNPAEPHVPACYGFPFKSRTLETTNMLESAKVQSGSVVSEWTGHSDQGYGNAGGSWQNLAPGTRVDNFQVKGLNGESVYQFRLNPDGEGFGPGTPYVGTTPPKTPGPFPQGLGGVSNTNGPVPYACPRGTYYSTTFSGVSCVQTCSTDTTTKTACPSTTGRCRDQAHSLGSTYCEAAGPDYCDVAWWKPTDNNGAVITGYDIYKCKCPSGNCDDDGCITFNTTVALDDSVWTQMGTDDIIYHTLHEAYRGKSNTNSYKGTYASFQNLDASSTYRFLVAAVNSVGSNRAAGHDNMTACVTTGASVPGKPFKLEIKSVVADSITIKWSMNTTGGANVTYSIVRKTCGGTTMGVCFANDTDASAVTTFIVMEKTFSNLQALQLYSFRVTGSNSAGVGSTSESLEVKTSAPSIPREPSNVGFLNLTNSVGFLAWTAPESRGGSAIDALSYLIQLQSNLPSADWFTITPNTGSSETLYKVGNLLANVGYRARLKAINVIGPSTQFSVASGFTSNGDVVVPEVISSRPVYVGVPTTDRILLAWEPPFTHGGAPITGYRIMYRNKTRGDPSEWAFTILVNHTRSTKREFTLDTGIVHGSSYAFKVAAINSFGCGKFSPESTLTSPLTTFPSQILSVPVLSNIMPTRLTLSWTPPISDGGADLQGYRILSRQDSTGSFKILIPNTNAVSTSISIGDLNPGRVYEFRVQAINTDGRISIASLSSGVLKSSAQLSVKLSGGETVGSFDASKKESFKKAVAETLAVPASHIIIHSVSNLAGRRRLSDNTESPEISDGKDSGSRKVEDDNVRRRLSGTGVQVVFSVVNVTAVDATEAANTFSTEVGTTLLTELQTLGVINVTATVEMSAPVTVTTQTPPTTADNTVPNQLHAAPVINNVEGTTATLAWVSPTLEQAGGSPIVSYRIQAFVGAPAQQKVSLYSSTITGDTPSGQFALSFKGKTTRCLNSSVSASEMASALEELTNSSSRAQSIVNSSASASTSNNNSTSTQNSSTSRTDLESVTVKVTRGTHDSSGGISNLVYSWTVTFISPEDDVPFLLVNDSSPLCSTLQGGVVNVTSYIKGVSKADSISQVIVPFTGSSSTAFVLPNLVAGRRYAFKIAAINELGVGAYSNLSKWTYTGAPPLPNGGDSPPSTSHVGFNNLTLRWKTPEMHSMDVIGFRIEVFESTPDIQVVSFYSESVLPDGKAAIKLGLATNTSCLKWDSSPDEIKSAVSNIEEVSKVTRSSSGSNGYRWTITFSASAGQVNALDAYVCDGIDTYSWSSDGQVRVSSVMDGHQGAWRIFHDDTKSADTHININGLNHSSTYTFRVAAISPVGVGTSSVESVPVETLPTIACLFSDWSPWGSCTEVRDTTYECGEEVCGYNDKSVWRCGRRSCAGEDVSLLLDGDRSVNMEKFSLHYQERSRILLEPPANGGKQCVDGRLREVRPCCNEKFVGKLVQLEGHVILKCVEETNEYVWT